MLLLPFGSNFLSQSSGVKPSVILVNTARAQNTTTLPPVDVSSPTFKFSVCDGPDLRGLSATDETKVLTSLGKTSSNYVPCNFTGAMMQVQQLINIAIVIGILIAIIGFCYAGFLFMTGKEADRTKAKGILPNIFIGFIIMLSAWFIVYQILSWLTNNGSGFTALLGKP